jgi:hypothetical protein
MWRFCDGFASDKGGFVSPVCGSLLEMISPFSNHDQFCKACHGKQEPIFAARKVFDLPPKSFRICKVCDQIYDHCKLITNLKFAEDQHVLYR